MSRTIKRIFVAALLLLAFVSYGCAGMSTSGAGAPNSGWDLNGDRDSAYPPYHHPSH